MNMTIEARPGGHMGSPGTATCLKPTNRTVAHFWCPRKTRSVRPAVPSRHRRAKPRPLLSSPPRTPSHPSTGLKPSSSGPFPAGFSAPLSNPTRCFFPSTWEEDQDDSSYLSAICYPEVVLEEDDTEDYDVQPYEPSSTFAGGPSSMWPRSIQSVDAVARRTADSDPVPEVLPRPYDPLANPPIEQEGEGDVLGRSLDPQKSMWRRGAAAAVFRAEENYRRAWKELQEAEKRLQSTRQVAAELEVLSTRNDTAALPVDEAPSGSTSAASDLSGPRLTHSVASRQGAGASTAGSDSDGEIWYIEACAEDWEPGEAGLSDPHLEGALEPASFADARDAADEAVVAAEGAMSCSKVALDKAATELIRRLKEEKELQAQVMNRNIEALDQGGQHQVAQWLVDQMDASAAAKGGDPCPAEGASEGADTWSLAVPLNLDLAMRGYDQHAVRFLRHLPYDQVLKIKAIPPTQETMSFAADAAAADALERLLSKPPTAAAPARPLPQALPVLPALPAPEQRASLPSPTTHTGFREEELRLFDPLEIEKDIEEHFFLPGFRGGDALPVLSPSDALRGKERRKGKGNYQTRLVLLGGAVCSLAAYMVANFELMVLAKDVSVILCAMSLAFLAAKFVWRHGDHAEETSESGVPSKKSPEGRMARRTRTERKKRSPSWDQVIWLIGGLAVVLSLSTMIALACKAAHSGLTAVTSLACSFVLKLLPAGAGLSSAALASASQTSAQALVQHVSMSLWLVIGGGILSSGVESLGSAAAWAMLLLCVAFSIVSAPICIASSTSRRVGDLLALARKQPV